MTKKIKVFVLRSPEGLYLNTEYRSSIRAKGIWRNRSKARLYKSLGGIRSALYGTAFPCLKRRVGMENYRIPTGQWTREDHQRNQEFWAAIKSIKTDEFFKALAEDGYHVEEVLL